MLKFVIPSEYDFADSYTLPHLPHRVCLTCATSSDINSTHQISQCVFEFFVRARVNAGRDKRTPLGYCVLKDRTDRKGGHRPCFTESIRKGSLLLSRFLSL